MICGESSTDAGPVLQDINREEQKGKSRNKEGKSDCDSVYGQGKRRYNNHSSLDAAV